MSQAEPSRPGITALLAELEAGLAELESVAAWRAYLDAQARFPRYSFANTLLIVRQRPDATIVAGYAAWRSLGRAVRAGERAIWIVAPLRRRGEAAGQMRPAGFRRVAVFDVSQTDGRELPLVCRPLEGEGPAAGFAGLLRVAAGLGFSVERCELSPGLYGDCTYRLRRIRVAAGISGAQATKTLAHELAHALLHEHVEDRPLAELEAESVAFVVCRHLGLDAGGYSFGYLATWAGGTASARAALRGSCRRIADAAGRIIAALSGEERPDAAFEERGAA